MVKPENARKILDDHFSQITLDEFKERHEIYVGESDAVLEPHLGVATSTRQIISYQPEAAPLRLAAYLACASEGLTEEQRDQLSQASDLVTSVCNQLEIDVYEPRKAANSVQYAGLPTSDILRIDREKALNSDLLIHLYDHQSQRSGEDELDFAFGALLPTVLISHEETRVSRLIDGIPAFKLHIYYFDLDDLSIELSERLTEIRPILEERRMAFSNFDKNIVGNRIRILREELELTRDDVATYSQGLLTLRRLREIEESTDKISNPTLLELRALSTILKTTVADLVEPDLNERLLSVQKREDRSDL